ncbi:MAG: signal peptidase I [Candidatus Marinimicrobia bacterium]|nr:signal peptidase I [Candidatus Neomarinimicrobiota bacterium]MDP6611080.1 signal peptidase I [Candidatus Neomarinimicrobiota bacterium]
MNSKISKIIHEIRALFILVIIVLTLKVTIFELYIVPTGSMENTIMTGDFLAGNRFVYGMRTPDWIGIPYTDIGFDVPGMKFPSFREPKRGDVIIFKFPRDVRQKYVKRCVAEPGDIIEVIDKLLYINNVPSPLPENGKFIMSPLSPSFSQRDIFLGKQGNKDYFKKLKMPERGDQIKVSPENAQLLLHLMLLDGHELTLVSGGREYPFTMVSPDELYRRKAKMEVYAPYYPQGNLLVPWSNDMPKGNLRIDGKPIGDLEYYTVEQDYYWAMGDNRDDSLDSRYWGFIPRKYILGEALFSYFSLDLKTWIPRFNRIGTNIR